MSEEPRQAAEFYAIDNGFARIDSVIHRAGPQRTGAIVLFTHPRSQTNLTAWPLPQLALRGIDGLCFNNRYTNSPAGTELDTVFEEMALDVAAAVQHARDLRYKRIVLMGHSAGGPAMAFYQRVAERGNATFAGASTLSGFKGFTDGAGNERRLPPADGLILRSVTIGTAASFLVRLDASVVDEATGEREPSLDMYAPVNGFDAASGTAKYPEEFLLRYRRAQAERMNRIVDASQAALAQLASGAGRFVDDDFVVIPRTRANPPTIDLSLAPETVGEYELVPQATVGRIRDVRPANLELPQNISADGAAVHRIAPMLTYRLTRVDPARFDPHAVTSGASGIDFDSSNSSTPPSLAAVTVPLLVIQGTGDDSNSVKLPTAELLYDSAASADRQLVFVDGANHFMRPIGKQFGDTQAIGAGRIGRWVKERFPLA